jgi:CubicO group peptidase (beta-lactamase class C family)
MTARAARGIAGSFPDGEVAPGWGLVADAYRRLFESGQELGSALAVYHRGSLVVDLWGGRADRPRWLRRQPPRPWARDTLAYLASATKAAPATLVHLLAGEGRLDIDAPVATYWPEFGVRGKGAITLRQVLCHTSGVVVPSRPMTAADVIAWRPVVETIADATPEWTPGTAHGYHGLTFGYILGEVIARVDDRTVGRSFADRIATPRGLDLWIGLPRSEASRVADLAAPTARQLGRRIADPVSRRYLRELVMPSPSLLYRAFFGSVRMSFAECESPDMYAAEEPTGGGIATARGLAGLYAAIIGADGRPALLSAATIDGIRRVETEGPDRTLKMRSVFGLGFALPGSDLWPAFGSRAFGYPGATGALGFADPDAGIGFGYVPNRMVWLLEGADARAADLTRAVYRVLADRRGSP